jgi:hypothetical protein
MPTLFFLGGFHLRRREVQVLQKEAVQFVVSCMSVAVSLVIKANYWQAQSTAAGRWESLCGNFRRSCRSVS